jgi:hypothetical protein
MSDSPSSGPIVVKVGGSLFDLPDLGSRLQRLLGQLPTHHVALVPGGGAMADVVRELDRWHSLGDESAHQLALRAMTVNAYFLQALLPAAVVVQRLSGCLGPWHWRCPVIVDAYDFAYHDFESQEFLEAGKPPVLPRSWAVTSDAIAARVAVLIRARELVLLKSTDPPAGSDWQAAAQAGFVDAFFGQAVGDVPVRALNFRSWRP